MLVALVVWLLAGLIARGLWLQMALMALSVYLVTELSNNNALIRIRSRMVSSVFIVLTCCNSVLFQSISGNLAMVCLIIMLLLSFTTYQKPETSGMTYYSSLFLGLASVFQIQVLYFVPLLWILSLTHLQSFSLRSWLASCLGLITPYWFLVPWFLYQQDYHSMSHHIMQLTDWQEPFNFSVVSLAQWLSFIFIQTLTAISITHFWLHSYEDRIRIRQLYAFFGLMGLTASLLLIIQPQQYNLLMRIVILCFSPFIAHYFSLTKSKLTNTVFISSMVLALVLTIINLYPELLSPLNELIAPLWNGL